MDCWGLRRLIFLHELGIELPSYSDSYATVADVAAIRRLVEEGAERDHVEVPEGEEKTFDAVLLRVGRDECHVATVVGRGTLLHIERGKTSCPASYRSGSVLSFRKVGFYRYRGMGLR